MLHNKLHLVQPISSLSSRGKWWEKETFDSRQRSIQDKYVMCSVLMYFNKTIEGDGNLRVLVSIYLGEDSSQLHSSMATLTNLVSVSSQNCDALLFCRQDNKCTCINLLWLIQYVSPANVLTKKSITVMISTQIFFIQSFFFKCKTDLSRGGPLLLQDQ